METQHGYNIEIALQSVISSVRVMDKALHAAHNQPTLLHGQLADAQKENEELKACRREEKDAMDTLQNTLRRSSGEIGRLEQELSDQKAHSESMLWRIDKQAAVIAALCNDMENLESLRTVNLNLEADNESLARQLAEREMQVEVTGGGVPYPNTIPIGTRVFLVEPEGDTITVGAVQFVRVTRSEDAVDVMYKISSLRDYVHSKYVHTDAKEAVAKLGAGA